MWRQLTKATWLCCVPEPPVLVAEVSHFLLLSSGTLFHYTFSRLPSVIDSFLVAENPPVQEGLCALWTTGELSELLNVKCKMLASFSSIISSWVLRECLTAVLISAVRSHCISRQCLKCSAKDRVTTHMKNLEKWPGKSQGSEICWNLALCGVKIPVSQSSCQLHPCTNIICTELTTQQYPHVASL